MRYTIYPEDSLEPTKSAILYIEGTEHEVRTVDRKVVAFTEERLIISRGRRSYRVKPEKIRDVIDILMNYGDGYVSETFGKVIDRRGRKERVRRVQ